MAKKLSPEVRKYFQGLAKKGAAKGGRARAANLTAEQLSEAGRKAAAARWKKTKGKTRSETGRG